MNTPVRRVALAVMGMIVLLMANLTYVQVVKAGDYRNDARNQRVLLAEYSRQRGQISAAGQVLATVADTAAAEKVDDASATTPANPRRRASSTAWGCTWRVSARRPSRPPRPGSPPTRRPARSPP